MAPFPKAQKIMLQLCLTPIFLVCLQAQTSTAAAPGASQNQAAKPESELVLKVTTRMVVVDVVVHDKKDQPLADLEASDFTLREDGDVQQISAFSFQHPQAAAVAPAQTVTPPNVFRNVPHYRSGAALNILLLDALNTTTLNQAYVRVEMVKFLEKIPPGSPVAIYALGRKLRLLQDFTTDLSELKKVIRAFKGEKSHVLSDPGGAPEISMTPQGWAEQSLAEKAPVFKAQIEAFAAEVSSSQTDVQIQQTMTALTTLSHMLKGYPGRKNLIWITEGIPMNIYGEPNLTVTRGGSPTPQKTTANSETMARAARSYHEQLALLGNLMADAQIAVYPVDARGLVGSALANVANNLGGQGAMGGASLRIEGGQGELLFQAHSNMRDIADKTGGTAFFNRNDLDNAVRNDMADGATYYTVGYYPSNKDWNGKFRKIQVAVNRPGIKLRYRTGYFAVQRTDYMKDHPQQREADLSLALDPDAPLATALQFALSVQPPGNGGNKVLLNYAVDPRGISFVPGADGMQHIDLDCAIRVFAPGKIDKPVRTDTARTATPLKPELYESVSKSYFPCQVPLDLAPGHYFLRAVVRDNTSGNLGSLNAQVDVPAVTTGVEGNPAEKR